MSKLFLKELGSIFKSKVAVIVCGLMTSVITARWLGPEGNGVLAALLIYPSLFLTIGSLGIRQSTTYFIGQEKYSLESIYSATLVIWAFTSVISILSCYILIKYFIQGTYSDILIYLTLLSIPFSLYNTYSSGIFLGKQKIEEFNKINWIPAALTFGFTTVFLILIPLGLAGPLIGSFLGVFILSFFVLKNIKRILSLEIKIDWSIINQMLRLGIIYAFSLLITNLNYKADILLLENMANSYELGIYSRAVSIVQYLWEIPMLLSTLIFARSAGSQNPNSFSIKVCMLLRFTVPVVIVVSAILYFSSDLVINILYGKSFIESGLVLKLLLPGIVLLTIFKVLNMDMAGKGKPWLSLKAMIPAIVINIVLNYLWIPLYGANGSALASTISYTIAAIIYLKIYSNAVNIPISSIITYTKNDKDLLVYYYKKFRKKNENRNPI